MMAVVRPELCKNANTDRSQLSPPALSRYIIYRSNIICASGMDFSIWDILTALTQLAQRYDFRSHTSIPHKPPKERTWPYYFFGLTSASSLAQPWDPRRLQDDLSARQASLAGRLSACSCRPRAMPQYPGHLHTRM
jgi:hypothetical protein